MWVPVAGASASRRRLGDGLYQAGRQGARFGEQEPANLRHVGAGGDMHQVILALGVEAVGTGEVVQRAVHLFEIPGIGQRHRAGAPCVGRDSLDVGAHSLGKADIAGVDVVDQFQAVDLQIILLAQPDAGAPVVPAIGALADAIQPGTDKSDGTVRCVSWLDQNDSNDMYG